MTNDNTAANTNTTAAAAVVFFDSWGQWWVTVAPDMEGAVAFGPTGAARRLPCEGLPAGVTAWELSRRAGNLVRATDEFGWDTLRAS